MANTEKKYNLKLSVVAGLLNDYHVFNLRKGDDNEDAYNNIKVMIFTDGKQYVENEATQMMHAGESSYKEFDGILPTLADPGGSTQWDVDNYGPQLKQKLRQYITLPQTTGQEIYDSTGAYTYYKNQFKVEFKETSQTYSTEESYITYKEEVDTLNGKAYLDKSLDSLSGKDSNSYVYINANIIHFSKYYGIYSSSSMPVPQLIPLIHDLDSLANYGLGIDANGYPYVSTLWGHRHWAGKSGGGEDTYFKNFLYSYDPTPAVSGYQIRNSNNDENWFADMGYTYDADEHDVSMFKSNYWGADTMWTWEPDIWTEKFPKGFALFGIENESDVATTLLSKNGRGTSESSSTYKADYLKIFDPETSIYEFEHKYIAGNDRDSCIVAVAYYADSDGNPHIFNTWFPVKMNGTTVTQEILYKEGQGTDKPKYIGSFIASILANIYTYEDDLPGVVGYMSDLVYLSDNIASFVKDMVFKARVTVNQESTNGLTHATNKLLLINKINYDDYVDTIIAKAEVSETDKAKIDYTNVNAVIKGIVKNIPLQFNIKYKEPNTDVVNQKNAQVIIKKIDGTQSTILRSSILAKDKLYQVSQDENGENFAEYLNANFIIHFIDKFTDDGSNITANYADLPTLKNDKLHRMFKNESGLMIPSMSRAMSAYGKYYSIGTYYSGHQDNAVKDLVKDEILIPYATVL